MKHYSRIKKYFSGFLFLILFLGGVSSYLKNKSMDMNFEDILLAPSWQYWMGTDALGRDFFKRVMSGSLVTVGVGLLSSFFSLVFAFLYALLIQQIGFWGRKSGLRLLELISAVPQFVFIALISTFIFSYFESASDSQILIFKPGSVWISFVALTGGLVFTRRTSTALCFICSVRRG